MRREQPIPQLALVVKWPQISAIDPLAHQLGRQLVERRLHATWAVAEPRQTETIAGWTNMQGRCEFALLAPARNVVEALKQFAEASEPLATVCTGTEPVRSQEFRTLCQLGVRTIVAETAKGLPGVVQSLPFGLLQFTPTLNAPTVGWIERWFGKSALELPGDLHSGKALVVVDLARLASTGGRGWRELDRVMHQIEDARRQGHVTSATMADLAAEMGRATAARPQRSILRAA
jgi:hypothetical protein